MEHISSHLPQLSEHQEGGAEGSQLLRVTPTQATSQHLRLLMKPPANGTCPFCRESTEPLGVVMGRCVSFWTPPQCECEAAQADRIERARIAEEARLVEVEKRRRREWTERIADLNQQSGIGDKFLKRRLDNFDVTPENGTAHQVALDYVKNWTQNLASGRGLFFVGNIGAGKTHLATGIANALLAQAIPVVCKTGGAILNDIRKTFEKDNTQTESDITDLFKNVDLLIIDDLGKEPATEWVISTLYGIVNERYERELPTIITTNYADEELARRLSRNGDTTTGEAILSRLHEMCDGVEMWFDDYRSK